jgi:hypothetical protein
VALSLTVPLLCLKAVPVQATGDAPAKMLAYDGPPLPFQQTYFGLLKMHDASGPLRTFLDIKAVPVPSGVRVFALSRDFAADPEWDTLPFGWPSSPAPTRWAVRYRFGRPCWLPRAHCFKIGNNALPETPW